MGFSAQTVLHTQCRIASNKRSEPPFCGSVHKLRLFMECHHHLRPVKMLFTALAKDWLIWGNGYCRKIEFHVYSDFSDHVSIILWGYYFHILGQILLNSVYGS